MGASAFALSIFLATPKLADSSYRDVLISATIAPLPPAPKRGQERAESGARRPDLNNVLKLDDLVHQQAAPRLNHGSALPNLDKIEGPTGGEEKGSPEALGVGPGIVGSTGRANDAPPKPPDPPKPAPRSVETDNKPLRVTSTVLQGKVIDRRVPIYPELAKRIRLQGDVAVEVIISPEGRVESVRAVSGHPMLTRSALDAARDWRFEPTLLNRVPVRVTGVITFVFKLKE